MGWSLLVGGIIRKCIRILIFSGSPFFAPSSGLGDLATAHTLLLLCLAWLNSALVTNSMSHYHSRLRFSAVVKAQYKKRTVRQLQAKTWSRKHSGTAAVTFTPARRQTFLRVAVYLDNALWPLKYRWKYVLLTVADLIPSVIYDCRLLIANCY